MKVSEKIEKLIPYVPGKPIEETQRQYGLSEVTKLASNENPLGPSEKVLEAVAKAARDSHRYPDASSYYLHQRFQEKYEIEGNRIVFGNGSDELIDLLIRVYCEPGDQIVTSQAAFVAYKIRAQANRCETVEIPFDSNYGFDFDALEKHIDQKWSPKKKLIFIANPNNPTGAYVSGHRIRKFLDKVGGRDDLMVVFDEAYTEFVRDPDPFNALPATKQFTNVVTMRTLSKVYGLAGFRVGVLFADSRTTDFINRVRTPFNVGSLAQAAALAAIDDEDYLRRSQEVNWQGLDYFYKELSQLGLPYVESQANFVFFDTLRDALVVNEELLKRGVILRPLKGYGFDQHLRMSVGLPEENQKAILALREVIAKVEVKNV